MTLPKYGLRALEKIWNSFHSTAQKGRFYTTIKSIKASSMTSLLKAFLST